MTAEPDPDARIDVQHFKDLLTLIDYPAWLMRGADGGLVYANPAAVALLGEALPDWLQRVHEDDREPIRNSCRQMALEPVRHQLRMDVGGKWQTLDVVLRFCYATAAGCLRQPAEIGQDSLVAAVARLAAEPATAPAGVVESGPSGAARDALANYRSLVENLPLNVFHKDRHGRITFANQLFCKQVGLPLEELIGKDDADLFDVELAAKYQRDDQWVLQTGKALRDVESHPKGDQSIFVEVIKAPITGDDGEIIGIQGMFWDVTARRKAEEALRQAKDIAEAASKAKSDFLANVSHEIRTPMNGIIGVTDLMLSSVTDPGDREHLELIQISAESLLSLINNILDFSKIEAGKVELESQRFDLRESLGDTMRSLAFRAHDRGLELYFEFGPDVPCQIIGDPVRLRQVIVNLVGNAIKFTETGSVKLDVSLVPLQDSAVRAAANSCRLKFVVTDTGIGIPREKQAHIFDEFEQADTSTTRKYGGTGLGLAISSRLVALMGGELKLESEPGVGTRFLFSIDSLCDAHAGNGDLGFDLGGKQVLLVVGHAGLRECFQRRLAQQGMEVVSAGSLEAANDLLFPSSGPLRPLDLVITEIDLPEGEGIQLARSIRSHVLRADLPVIFLANTNTRDIGLARAQLKIDHQLTKPVKDSDLFASIETVLRHHRNDGAEAPTVELAHAIPEPARGGLRILVAEDNPVNQKLMVALLKRVGHEVVVAETGSQAVSLFDEQNVDLVLMDIQMPEMDGFDATYQIRKRQATSSRRVPIIALTAHASPTDRKRCLASGMDEYLAKPIRAPELYAMIDALTGHRTTIDLEQPVVESRPLAIDWEAAFGTVGGSRELLDELLGVFVGDHKELVNNLNLAILSGNAKEVRLSAHSMRGALTHLGAREAAKLAGKMEELASLDPKLTDANQLFEDFEQEVDEAVSEINRFLNRNHAATRPDA